MPGKPRRRKSVKKRQKLGYLPVKQGVLIIVGMLVMAWLLNVITHAPAVQPYSIVGPPSIDASFIDNVLESYHSPAAGKGQALYDDGLKYGIDPAYALAFFMEESSFGTQGVARVTHSLGNIRATEGYASYQGYRSYKTWEAGFEDWYKLIADEYIARRGLSTVDQIIPVYAPSGDNNNEAAYIQAVEQAVDRWHSGSVKV